MSNYANRGTRDAASLAALGRAYSRSNSRSLFRPLFLPLRLIAKTAFPDDKIKVVLMGEARNATEEATLRLLAVQIAIEKCYILRGKPQ